MAEYTIDPKVFIRPPYWQCPQCNAEDTYGVLMICDDSYMRRCKECWHDERIYLPQLNKKVLYIDQFAISNMMKGLNPGTKAYQKGNVDEFWVTLFEKLDMLSKKQLIVCPDSDYHEEESMVAPYYQALKQMYEQLSGGLTFTDRTTIKCYHVYDHARNWINGKGDQDPELDINAVIHGNVNGWQERFRLGVNWSDQPGLVDALRESRERKWENLGNVFKEWQTEAGKKFEDWFEEEFRAIGPCILDEVFDYSSYIIESIFSAFRNEGVSEQELPDKAKEYLLSPSLRYVPFFKIYCMLLAALARKAAGGRKNLPNQGTAADFEMISLLLPYCDALFIDNECHGYLNEAPLKDEIRYGAKVFSLNTREAFLAYLDEVETNAPEAVLKAMQEVYLWKEPYTTLYRDSKE